MINVLIADDHAGVRRGMIEIMKAEVKDVVCVEAEYADQAVAQLQIHRWNLIILDIAMLGRSGIDLLRDLERAQPGIAVLVLSTYPEDQLGKRVLKAGARGYLNKASGPEELVKAIRKILAGGRYISSAHADKLVPELQQVPD
jgi:DNA-binding NarL/FixJ family response regulator